MKKIAIFVEGQTELIFIRNFLLRVIDPSILSFECLELINHTLSSIPFIYQNPYSKIHFMIINVNNDESVLSSIKEREKNLVDKKGYDRIIGLRDMYCDKYDKLSHGKIDKAISNLIIKGHNQTINTMAYPDRIMLFFAIMEIEAWFLAMYKLFEKIDDSLTLEQIKQGIGINLKNIDPETQFYKPSNQICDIFKLSNLEYNKKFDEIENICNKMDIIDFECARENGRCKCFDSFYKEILSLA